MNTLNYNPSQFQEPQNQENLKKSEPSQAFFFGQIVGGTNFESSGGLFCEMILEIGPKWLLKNCLEQSNNNSSRVIESIQTQTAFSEERNLFLWSHPFDLEFEVSNINGWPKAIFKVWRVDDYNTIDIVSYGIMNFPKQEGSHKLEINTWAPEGSWQFGNQQFFFGNQARLSHLDLVKYHEDRTQILGSSNGQIIVECDLIYKNFEIENIINKLN